MLEDDIDIRNFGNDAHEHRDVRMAQNTLHYYFVLDLLQELVGQTRVEYLFDRYRRTVELAYVNCREAALPDLVSDL